MCSRLHQDGGFAPSSRKIWRLVRQGTVATAWVATLLFSSASPAKASSSSSPSFLVIVLDTLNPTHLGCYGGPSTPVIDSLANAGTRFLDTWCESPVTAPSIASLLTSRHLVDHGVYANRRSFDRGPKRLPQHLAELGFRTAAFVSNGEITRGAGFFWGFEDFDDTLPDVESNRPHIAERNASETVAKAGRWLTNIDDDPFFCLVHLNDAHGPYDSGAPVPADPGGVILPVSKWNFPVGAIPAYQAMGKERTLNQYIAAYNSEIGNLDRSIGTLLSGLRDRGQADDTWVFLTGDHGESMGAQDRYFQHGSALNEEQLQVPMILAGPGIPQRVESVPTLVADIMPTILGRAGINVPGLVGRDLQPLLIAEQSGERASWNDRWRHAILAPMSGTPVNDTSQWTQAIRRGQWKFVRKRDGSESSLYDLQADRHESHNLAGIEQYAAQVATLDSLLMEWEVRYPLPEEVLQNAGLTPTQRLELEAVGYLD